MTDPLTLRPSRRDQRRQETIRDIKTAALDQLAANGEAGISMRAIARELDITEGYSGRPVKMQADDC